VGVALGEGAATPGLSVIICGLFICTLISRQASTSFNTLKKTETIMAETNKRNIFQWSL